MILKILTLHHGITTGAADVKDEDKIDKVCDKWISVIWIKFYECGIDVGSTFRRI